MSDRINQHKFSHKNSSQLDDTSVDGDALSSFAQYLTPAAAAGSEILNKVSASRSDEAKYKAALEAARKQAAFAAAEADADPTNQAKQDKKAHTAAVLKEAEGKAAFFATQQTPGMPPGGAYPAGGYPPPQEDFFTKYKTPLMIGGAAVVGLFLISALKRR